jgi:ATP:guanido phosphotransferase, C-terminal catalytic domain/ATP:guanido phosphotransferase, N-terminal domain
LNPLGFPEESTSLIKKHLSQKIYKALEPLTTDSEFTLAKAIRSGRKNPDSAIGIYAGDAQSYHKFSLVFDPIISEYHGISKTRQHKSDIKKLDLPLLDPEGKYIQSTRIRIARNLKGFNFPCHMTLDQRRNLEKKIIAGFSLLTGDLKGRYYSLEHADKKESSPIDNNDPGFPKGDRFQDAAGINSDFPKSRGVYHSFDQQLMVWINEEDHLRIISLEKTSDLSSVYNRLCRAHGALNKSLDFARDKKYGYLTSCPTNIGTAMRAGVHIQLEKLEQKKEILLKLIKDYNLQIRGTCGEKTKIQNSVFDISNRQRLGISESRIIQNLHKGLLAIIKAEKTL